MLVLSSNGVNMMEMIAYMCSRPPGTHLLNVQHVSRSPPAIPTICAACLQEPTCYSYYMCSMSPGAHLLFLLYVQQVSGTHLLFLLYVQQVSRNPPAIPTICAAGL